MKEIRKLPNKSFMLTRIDFPAWAERRYYIYTCGRYFYLVEESYWAEGCNMRIYTTIYQTTSLKKIFNYINEVARMIGLKVLVDKIGKLCYNIRVVE